MDELFKEKLLQLVTGFATACTSSGYKMARKNLALPDAEMDRNMQRAMEPLIQLVKELYDSREEYQKAADTMAAEHKVERDAQAALISKLQAEIEELEAEQKEMEWYFDRD